jgi:hypothetical protein
LLASINPDVTCPVWQSGPAPYVNQDRGEIERGNPLVARRPPEADDVRMVLLCGAIFSEIENEKKHFYTITNLTGKAARKGY